MKRTRYKNLGVCQKVPAIVGKRRDLGHYTVVAPIASKDRLTLLKQLAETDIGAEFTCNSSSMETTISVGEKVRVRAVSPKKLQVGDVVVFEGKMAFVLHRIVLISPRRTWFLHLGDAPSVHGPRRALMSSIIGRVDGIPSRTPKASVYVYGLRNVMAGFVRRSRRYFYW